MTKNDIWNSEDYSQFTHARTRPVHDLLTAISPSIEPKCIYDLGCGTGNSSILIQQRWPTAKVIGIDSSENMLAAATKQYPQLAFVQTDFTQLHLTTKADLLFSNAALHWTNQHATVLKNFANNLNSNGIVAIQMPNNFHQPSHQINLNILQQHQPWQPLIKKLCYPVLSSPLYTIPHYYNLLIQAGFHKPMLWQTEYCQAMPDHQAIYQWLSGTALRPVLSKMSAEDKLLFEKKYTHQLIKAYPSQSNGQVIFLFKRLFMIAEKL